MLVLCPNSLKRTWATELGRFAPEMGVDLVEGTRRERRAIFGRTDAVAILVNYESARNEIASIRALLARRSTVLVLDESHYIKNFRSLNSIAAQHFAPLSDFRWLLTGTPVTNRATDLYPQICVAAAAEPFGSHASFEARFGDKDLGGRARELLADKIRPFLLRRTKEECLDLPPKLFVDFTVDLPPWQRKLYEAMRDGLAAEVDAVPSGGFRHYLPTGLVRLLRLSQVASNPRLVYPDERRVPGKIVHLDRTVDELMQAGRKVIVWSYYVDTIRLLEARYRRYGSASLHGATPPRESPERRHALPERSGPEGACGEPGRRRDGIHAHWRQPFHLRDADLAVRPVRAEPGPQPPYRPEAPGHLRPAARCRYGRVRDPGSAGPQGGSRARLGRQPGGSDAALADYSRGLHRNAADRPASDTGTFGFCSWLSPQTAPRTRWGGRTRLADRRSPRALRPSECSSNARAWLCFTSRSVVEVKRRAPRPSPRRSPGLGTGALRDSAPVTPTTSRQDGCGAAAGGSRGQREGRAVVSPRHVHGDGDSVAGGGVPRDASTTAVRGVAARAVGRGGAAVPVRRAPHGRGWLRWDATARPHPPVSRLVLRSRERERGALGARVRGVPAGGTGPSGRLGGHSDDGSAPGFAAGGVSGGCLWRQPWISVAAA